MLLSIIVLTKDNPSELHSTLSSLLPLSSVSDFEVIVIDKSITPSLDLLSNFPYKIVHHIQISNGIFSAMTESLSLVHGKWIWFLNSGDLSIADSSFLSLLKYYSDQPCDGLIFFCKTVDSFHRFISYQPIPFLLSSHLFLFLKSIFPSAFSVNHQSVIFRTSFHQKYHYPDLPIGSDYLVIRQLLNSRFRLIPRLLSTFYASGLSSVSPSSFHTAFRHVRASLSQQLYRRAFITFIKYLFSGIFTIRNLNNLRRIRYCLYFRFFNLFFYYRRINLNP